MDALTSHMIRVHDHATSFSTTGEDEQEQGGLPLCIHVLSPVDPAAHVKHCFTLDPVVADDILPVVTGGPRLLLRLPPLAHRLVQNCAFCSHWVASPRILKAHVRRSHPDLWQRAHAGTLLYCKQHSHLLGASHKCRLCGSQVQNLQMHATGCSVLFQVGAAAAIKRELWPSMDLGPVVPPGGAVVQTPSALAGALLEVLDPEEWGDIPEELATQLVETCALCGKN